MTIQDTIKKIDAVRASLEREYTDALNARVVEIKRNSEQNVKDGFIRDLRAFGDFKVLTKDLPSLTREENKAAIDANRRYAAITLALIDYFRANPDRNALDVAEIGVELPPNTNIDLIKYVAQASLIYDRLNGARPMLSLNMLGGIRS